MSDFVVIVGLTLLACLAAGAVGTAVLHRLRGRSLRYQLAVAAFLPVAAVIATVLANVWLMFLSPHDTTVIMVALVIATPLAALGAWLVTRRVARGSARLGAAMQQLVVDSTSTPTPRSSTDDEPIPAELAAAVVELETTRQRLGEARRRQQAAEDARRELVSFMSHDLRTPLAGLRAVAEGLEDNVITDVPQALAHLRTTVTRMSHLVDDLFELSRVQGDRPARAQTMVSLRELILDVSTEATAVARGRDVDLLVSLPEDDRLAVVGSADDLARALTNLLANAIRLTEPDQMVRISAERASDGHIRVEVVDGCGGIPAEHLGRVFDAGWRGNQARTEGDGAGLGLAIARGVVESHAGTIEVANVTGGCRFGVDLPEADRTRMRQSSSDDARAADTAELRGT